MAIATQKMNANRYQSAHYYYRKRLELLLPFNY